MPEDRESPIDENRVKEGRSPLQTVPPADLKATAAALVRASVTSPSGTFPRELCPIDHDLLTDPLFDEPTLRQYSSTFRSWQTELLLNQAADLLERCIRDRSLYDDLKAKWLDRAISAFEFDQLNAIHTRETAAGWYTLNYQQSAAELSAVRKCADHATEALRELGAWADVTDENGVRVPADDVAAAVDASRAAKAAAVSTYREQHQTVLTIDVNGAVAAAGSPKPDFIADATKRQSLRMSRATRASIEAQKETLAGTRDQCRDQSYARTVRSNWDYEDIAFRRERSDVAVLINSLKKEAMRARGGPYAYMEQMSPVLQRFSSDLREAYARILAADVGLRTVFGIAMPAVPTVAGDGRPPYSFLDRAILWTRAAINRLNTFAQRDQHYVETVSVRRSVGQAEWEEAVRKASASGQPIELSFELPSRGLPPERHARLRGISVACVGVSELSLARVTVRVPRAASVLFSSDPVGSSRSLNQRDCPAVVHGRVRPSGSSQPDDVFGTTVLFNASPFSDSTASPQERNWLMSVSNAVGEPLDGLQDIWLQLHLVAQLSL